MLKISNYNTPVNMIQQLGKNPTVKRPDAATSRTRVSQSRRVERGAGSAFANELSQASGASREIRFSKHALARLHSRKLEMTPRKVAELSRAMDKAESRGARETLILTDDAAFVVSPASRTVISAFDRENLREGVFTSIDSAVIL